MPEIMITVRNKIAQVYGIPHIVCGNSDYSAIFDFDSEWDEYNAKTMRIVWKDMCSGNLMYNDVLFEGSTVMIPKIYGTDRVCIGVYAGDIHTTTPACVECTRCITDDSPVHESPTPDVYNQLMQYLAELANGTSTAPVIMSPVVSSIESYRIGTFAFSEVE